MEFTVHLDARVGVLPPEGETSDRLLTALEELEAKHQLAAPATSENTAASTIGATFCVSADNPDDAMSLAFAAFIKALRAAGVEGEFRLTEMRIGEDDDEAADAEIG